MCRAKDKHWRGPTITNSFTSKPIPAAPDQEPSCSHRREPLIPHYRTLTYQTRACRVRPFSSGVPGRCPDEIHRRGAQDSQSLRLGKVRVALGFHFQYL